MNIYISLVCTSFEMKPCSRPMRDSSTKRDNSKLKSFFTCKKIWVLNAWSRKMLNLKPKFRNLSINYRLGCRQESLNRLRIDSSSLCRWKGSPGYLQTYHAVSPEQEPFRPLWWHPTQDSLKKRVDRRLPFNRQQFPGGQPWQTVGTIVSIVGPVISYHSIVLLLTLYFLVIF